MHPETVKVKPWAEGQGDFVTINERDFDDQLHTLYEPGKKAGHEKQQASGRPVAKGSR